ncbi:Uncharacterised protein [Vibrio cholerae]|nr:Uncharacterised protein [Vibrio cholerae]CSI63447.1 Uncharacterised protein [Vibrio cholerae]
MAFTGRAASCDPFGARSRGLFCDMGELFGRYDLYSAQCASNNRTDPRDADRDTM